MGEWLTNDYYRLIFEKSFDAILLTRLDGQVVRANPATSRMFQMTEEEIRALGCDGLVDADDARLTSAIKTRDQEGVAYGELTFIRKDGTHFPGGYCATLFEDRDGAQWSALIIRDMTIHHQMMEELEQSRKSATLMASLDYLTGTLNRRFFVEHFSQELERAKRSRQPIGLLLLDIDHFKWINDVHGHLIGDQVLQRFARCVADSLRPYDELGRFGGDEFIVLLPETTLEESVAIAERIRRNVSELEVANDDVPILLTVSIGVTGCSEVETSEPDVYISKADEALYDAKKKKNAIAIA